jgi:cytoskeletal protein RodZ
MPTVPEQLRAGREAMGLTQHQVADITKIRTDHIRALEEGNYEAFAAPVYVRGFVRTYAQLVRLDPRATVALLDAELRRHSGAEIDAHSVKRRGVVDILMLQLSKVNWRVALPTLAVALVILTSVLGYRAWIEHRSRDPLVDLGPGLYQPPPANDTLLLPALPSPK